MYRFLTALLFTMTMANPVHAESKGGAYGYSESLIFTSNTSFPSDGETRALCTLVRDWHIFSLPIRREVMGQVLSDPACEGQSTISLTPEIMEQLVSAGMVPENLPATPPLTVGWLFWVFAGISLSALPILYVALSRSRRKPIAEIDVPVTTRRTPMFDETLLTTMFHTARLNGEIDQVTLQGLIKSYKTLTGTTVTPAMITAKYALKTDTVDLLGIMPQFVGLERDTMMKACMDVAAADGIIQKSEHDFLMALGSALGLAGDMFRIQIHEAMKPSRQKMSNAGFAPA